MHTDKGLFDGVHNPIGCIHSQVVPQKTKVHFKGTPFLLFYVQWPVLLRRRIHIHYIHSKHHKELGTPVPSSNRLRVPNLFTFQPNCSVLLLCAAKCRDDWL